MNNYIIINDIITDLNTFCKYRVIYKNKNSRTCYLIQLDTTKSNIKIYDIDWLENQINEGDFILNSPDNDTLEISMLSEKQNELMEKRFKIIQSVLQMSPEPLLYEKKYKARSVQTASSEHSVGQNTVYKCIRLYLQGGKTKICLAPNFGCCGGKGKERLNTLKVGRKSHLHKNDLEPDIEELANGISIDENHYSNMVKTINRTLLSKGKISIRQAYDRLKYDFYSPRNSLTGKKEVLPHYKIPTYNQFYYVVRKLRKSNVSKFLKAKDGSRSFDLKYRPVLGSASLEAVQPGFRYEIDATKPFIPLLDSTRKFSIGTATVYYVIDAFSIMIVGFYIGLDNASKKTACSALLSCIDDKKGIAQKYGIETKEDDFFVNLLPKNLTSDRGELVGELGDRVVSHLGVNVETTASYRGDMKGIVEKAFDVTEKDLLGIIPNYTIKDWKKITRGDIRNDQKPVLTINNLRNILIKHIKKHNSSEMKSYPLTKEMIADEVNPTPNNIWKWGVKNLGCDGIRPNIDYVRYVLTEEKTASITQSGIEFKGLNYSHEMYDHFTKEWFSDARANGRKKIKIHMDERNIGTILVKLDDTDEILKFIQTPRTRKQYGEITMFEYEQYLNRKKNTMTKNKDINNQTMIDHLSELNETFAEIKVKPTNSKPINTNRRYHRENENRSDRLTQSVVASNSNEINVSKMGKINVEDIRALRKQSLKRKLDKIKIHAEEV